MSLTLEEARARRACRVCGGPIEVGVQPAGWKDDYGEMVWPVALTLDYGREFAHTGCLNSAMVAKAGEAPASGDLAERAIKALRVYELGQELRPDRKPPLPVQEYEAIRLERAGLMAELGWRPNEGRR